MRRHPPDDGELRLERIDPAVAAAEINAAMNLTEMTLDPPVSDDYAGRVRLRCCELTRSRAARSGPSLRSC